ncbi:MAG: tetratricopeptide repeat protein [Verrucomicrobiota bacterium]
MPYLPPSQVFPVASRWGRGCVALFLGGWAVARAEPTFNRDVAPILYRHCTPCHQPGSAGPFPLRTYEEARSKAPQLLKAVESRTMPPWMPEPGHGDFIGERRLADAEIQVIRSWVAAGSPEGQAEDRPEPPAPPREWSLGTPDLILDFPESYLLGPEGRDVYRNFVVPIPTGTNRFVRAFEFQPRNPAVHHARLLFDASGESRRRDSADPVCGFGGTMPPARFPPGHLLGWVPGRSATVLPDGMAWPLDGVGDLVVQLHLQRTGRPETIRPRLGLYLTNRPPTLVPVLLGLLAQTMDIPAGAKDYTVVRSVRLPVDVELLAVLPHAHLLGRRFEFTATPPGGESRSLLRIPGWRFHWQDEYRYARPVSLSAGTVLEMRITYDNSAGNPSNPNVPPRRVLHGPDSADEMGELWLQLLPKDAAGASALRRLHRELTQQEIVADFGVRIGREPANAAYRLERGKALGALGRQREAFEDLNRAVELDPRLAEAHQYIGVSFLERRLFTEAKMAFEEALALDPNLPRCHVGLGLIAEAEGDPVAAERHLSRALELNPADEAIRRKVAALRGRNGSGSPPSP